MKYVIEIHRYAQEMNKLHIIRNEKTITLRIPGCTDIKSAKKYLKWTPAPYPGYTRVIFKRATTTKGTNAGYWENVCSGVLVSMQDRKALLDTIKEQPLDHELYSAVQTVKFL